MYLIGLEGIQTEKNKEVDGKGTFTVHMQMHMRLGFTHMHTHFHTQRAGLSAIIRLPLN